MPANSRRLRAVIWLVAVNILATACLLEAVLRVQQIYELDLRPEAIMIGLSDELNHVHLPEGDWDRNGLRAMNEPNAQSCAARVLFMGDSFMEGVGPNDTVPVHVKHFFARASGRELCVFNSACSSYSPSIFVPQAKKLIPLLKPDIVVIDVDETDLFDDYHRYRELVTRDDAGSIAAVRRSPLTDQFQRGLIASTSKALYLHRFLAKLYFTKITYPKSFADYYRGKPADFLWASRLPAAEAREKYGAAIGYFDATLEDLTRTALSRVGSPDGLVYIHHPHLEHLRSEGGGFNDIVATTVREVAARHNVRFYDTTDDLKAQFGSHPERYYIPNDMHFNERGQRAYGVAVAKYLASGLGHN